MRLKGAITLFLTVAGCVFILNTINCMAVESGYSQVWNADDMPLGKLDSYDGLTIIQPAGGTAYTDPIEVVNSYRSYEDRSFTKAIKTGGNSVVGSNYVPTARAIKIDVPQKCYMTIYMYGASTNQNVENVCISKMGSLVDNTIVNYNEKVKKCIYLETSGIYYIYSTDGSVGIHYISLHMINGDLNRDEDVEWDDLRIFRKRMANQSACSQKELNEMDVNKNTVLDWNDYTALENIIRNKGNYVSQFYNNKVWNVSNMPTGKYANYDGLEFIGDLAHANQLEIGSSNKKYGDLSFTKRIKTGGEGNNGFGHYLYNRSVKINVNSPCYMTIYMTSSSSNVVNPKAVLSSEGGVVKEMSLANGDLRKYVLRVDGPDSFYLYGVNTSLGVYYIELSNTLMGDLETGSVSKTISVVSGQSYEYALTVDKGRYPGVITYAVTYDAGKLRPTAVGLWAKAGSGNTINTDENIKIISNSGGVLKFTVDTTDENWSGILTKVKFEGIGNGNTTIAFGIE